MRRNSIKNITLEVDKDITLNKVENINNLNEDTIEVNQIPSIEEKNIISNEYLMLIPIVIFTATLVCLFKIK